MAKRCALALLCVAVLPAAAEDAVWSGAAPAATFTGSATAGAGDSHAATADAGHPPAATVTKCKHCSDHAPASMDGQTRADEIADGPDAASTTESRLASGWVLALLVAGVTGCGALACYAMGFFSCGNRRAARKKRAVEAVVMEEDPRDEESALPTQQPLVQQSVVAAVAAPLSAYQVVSSPAPFPGPMPSTYYAAPAMAASGAVPPSAAAYYTAAPQASMSYSVAPPIAAPEPMPFLPTEPLPVR